MMKALSLDLRQRIAAAVDGGMSHSEAARRFAVSRSSVIRVIARRRETGTLQAKRHPGGARRISIEQHALVAAQLRAHPDVSLDEHCRLWQQQQGTRVAPSTLWRTLRRMEWSHKKRACVPASATRVRDKSGKSKFAT
jgi:transposase